MMEKNVKKNSADRPEMLENALKNMKKNSADRPEMLKNAEKNMKKNSADRPEMLNNAETNMKTNSADRPPGSSLDPGPGPKGVLAGAGTPRDQKSTFLSPIGSPSNRFSNPRRGYRQNFGADLAR